MAPSASPLRRPRRALPVGVRVDIRVAYAASHREHYELSDGLRVHLLHYAASVDFYRFGARAKLMTDLLRRLSVNHQLHHLAFALCEPRKACIEFGAL